MSANKRKKRKTTSPDAQPKSGVENFREIADQLATEAPAFDAIVADPWPSWMNEIARVFTRIVAPEVMKAANNRDDEMMYGHVSATVSQMIDAIREGQIVEEMRKLDNPQLKVIEDQLAIIVGPEAGRINNTLKAAADLPLSNSASFYKAYADGLANGALDNFFDRINSSTTASICFFILMLRGEIEKGSFKNVTQLAELYLQVQAIAGDGSAKNADLRSNIIAQFRKICSTAKLKLTSRGRPSGK
jgi:hypothetical protein